MNVMRFAAALSELQDRAQLDLPLLALAFQQRLSKHLSGKVNPFTLPAPESFTPPVAPASSAPQTVARRSRSKSPKSLAAA